MTKRLVSLALLAMTLVVLFIPAAMANETWYVYTDDGKTLNVRSQPRGEVVGRLNYGDPVDVIVYDRNGWSLIWYRIEDPTFPREGEAYVDSRFLVRNPPAGRAPQTNTATTITSLNVEFRAARQVTTPYTVVARPSRPTGWVNLRWAPCVEAERIATCAQGKVLVVLCELKNWLQVQDPDTGMVGFISKKYTMAQ